MRFGSVCSGIEAASVAWHSLGWQAAWLAEIEPFPSAVLKHHYPTVPNLGDMTALPDRILSGEVEAPDLFCGGTPCQAFSVAGLRQSLADARGNLSLTFCEIADAIDSIRSVRGEQPAVVVWENVPGVLSTADNAFGCFLGALAGMSVALDAPDEGWTGAGCVAGPTRTVAWRVLDAQYFGVAQRRRRVFVVASARKGFDPAAVLFEFDGVRRDSAPSREAREATARGAAGGAGVGGVVGTLGCNTGPQGHGFGDFLNNQAVDAGHLVAFGGNRTSGPIDVAPALNACGTASGRQDFETEAFLVQPTLRGEGFDASEDGTGRGTPLVPVAMRESGQGYWMQDNIAGTLRAEGEDRPSRPSHVIGVPVAFDTTQITHAANRSNPKPGDPCHPLAAGAHAPAIAFHPTQDPISSTDGSTHCLGTGSKQGTATVAVCFDDPRRFNGPHGGLEHGDLHPTLESTNPKQIAMTAMQVRRLTPTECERLQGFPDGYTAIPWRGKPAAECPDGPRYKALGNSWAVPVVAWIGARIGRQLGTP